MTEEVTHNADTLAKVYTKIRAKRLELEKQVEDLKEQQGIVAAEILELCKQQGVTTMRTAHGTISKRINKSYWTNDWESMYKFIKEHDAYSLLQQRIHNSNMEQYLKDHADQLPPGLNADITQTVVITKR